MIKIKHIDKKVARFVVGYNGTKGAKPFTIKGFTKYLNSLG